MGKLYHEGKNSLKTSEFQKNLSKTFTEWHLKHFGWYSTALEAAYEITIIIINFRLLWNISSGHYITGTRLALVCGVEEILQPGLLNTYIETWTFFSWFSIESKAIANKITNINKLIV